MLDEIMAEAKSGMVKAVEAFRHEIGTVRTGRASATLLDAIRVEYYGSQVALNQVANVSVPEPRLITITAFDKTAVPEIEKAIQASNLGLTPSNDGNIVRLPIPQLTEERRRELVKIVRQMGEECKVSVRNHRRDANDLFKEAQREGEVPEDDAKRGQDQVQVLTDGHVKSIDEIPEGQRRRDYGSLREVCRLPDDGVRRSHDVGAAFLFPLLLSRCSLDWGAKFRQEPILLRQGFGGPENEERHGSNQRKLQQAVGGVSLPRNRTSDRRIHGCKSRRSGDEAGDRRHDRTPDAECVGRPSRGCRQTG